MYLRVILVFVFVVSCTSEKNKFKPSKELSRNISLNRVGHFTINTTDSDNIKLGRLRAKFSSNDAGNIFVFLDELQQKIFLVEKNGEIINSIGKTGRGPREFIRVQGYDLDSNNNVVVFDESQNLIKIFKSDGTLLTILKLFEDEKYYVPSRGLVATDSTFFLQVIKAGEITDPNNSKLIAGINYEGEIIGLMGSYDPYISQDNHYHTSHSFFIDKNNNEIFTNLVTSPRIQIFDLNSNSLLAYFGYESPNYKKLEKEITRSLPRKIIQERSLNQSYGIGVYATEKYILHHFQNLSTEWFETNDNSEKKDFLVVYDRTSHDFIQEISLPHFLGLVHDNKLYLIKDSNPESYTIAIYELLEEV